MCAAKPKNSKQLLESGTVYGSRAKESKNSKRKQREKITWNQLCRGILLGPKIRRNFFPCVLSPPSPTVLISVARFCIQDIQLLMILNKQKRILAAFFHHIQFPIRENLRLLKCYQPYDTVYSFKSYGAQNVM